MVNTCRWFFGGWLDADDILPALSVAWSCLGCCVQPTPLNQNGTLSCHCRAPCCSLLLASQASACCVQLMEDRRHVVHLTNQSTNPSKKEEPPEPPSALNQPTIQRRHQVRVAFGSRPSYRCRLGTQGGEERLGDVRLTSAPWVRSARTWFVV